METPRSSPIPFEIISEPDMRLIRQIREKLFALVPDYQLSTLETEMDVGAAHLICGLRLQDMLDGRPIDLVHDVAGVGRHLDRENGLFTDCFWPRYAGPGVSPRTAFQVACEMADNWPEASIHLTCNVWKYRLPFFRFTDEDGTVFHVDAACLLHGMQLLLADTDLIPTLPEDKDDLDAWVDWLGQCDADHFDALAQMCCLGEIVYG